MATRIAARYVSRRLSSNGKVLSEEEKAAENVYIKLPGTLDHKCVLRFNKLIHILTAEPLEKFLQKMEQEKLDKLARKGPKPDETPATSSGGAGSVADAKPSAHASSTPKVSTDNHRNYAVVAGIVTIAGAVGWYLRSRKTKTEEVQD
ncbi:hypothetical protein CDL12_30267 [Handroanthus impetiginosus]|uniref:Uncharacterized protein n=1 Tax=Handroanthus impetiginosus TaxID=429701 RepID=A0A2G9FWK0_9LAMI|nr:hypothetical protein CDL12_30267 [Handroanthus impetiginosus]